MRTRSPFRHSASLADLGLCGCWPRCAGRRYDLGAAVAQGIREGMAATDGPARALVSDIVSAGQDVSISVDTEVST